MRACKRSGAIATSGVRPRSPPTGEAGEAFEDGCSLLGVRALEGAETAWLDAHAGVEVVQLGRLLGRARLARRTLVIGDEAEEAEQPPGGDHRSAYLVGTLDEGAHRHDEHGSVPVYGDKLADRDGAVHRHPCR